MRCTATALLVLSLAGCGGDARDREPPRKAAAPSHAEGSVPSFDGVPIAYTVAGGGDGALLFIHGWSCDRTYWTAQVDALSGRQKVVTVDLAGHGDSGAAREEWSVPVLARDVEAVIAALDLPSVVLIGHSMSGSVALEVARRLPERVVGVIGVDTFQEVEPPSAESWSALVDRLRADFPGACSAFVSHMFLPDADPDLVREVTADVCAAPPGVAVALLAALPDHDLARALETSPVPVRAINGSIFPTDVAAVRAHHPGFDAVILEGVGHFPMLERPEELNRQLERIVEEITAGGHDLGS